MAAGVDPTEGLEFAGGLLEHRPTGAGHYVGDVGCDRSGGRPRAGARPLDEDASDPPALDEQGVEHPRGQRQRVVERRQGRVDPHRNAVALAHGGGDQLDPVPQVAGQPDVEQFHALDAFDLGGREIGGAAERQGGQQGDLVGGVKAADVHGRIGLGVA